MVESNLPCKLIGDFRSVVIGKEPRQEKAKIDSAIATSALSQV